METITPVLVLEKFRKYSNHNDIPFYLAKGIATENRKPKVNISRWAIDDAYRMFEGVYGLIEGTLRPEKLYESHRASSQDPEARQKTFSVPAKWLLHLILNPSAPTETQEYILRDESGKPLQESNTPRVLNPIKRYKEGETQIVEANVFDLLFDLKDGKYDPEMLDPETGFLNQAPKSKGLYSIWFGLESKLYASILGWEGRVHCHWEPSYSDDHTSFRGVSTGNFPLELLESEEEAEAWQFLTIGEDVKRGNYKVALERAERAVQNLRGLVDRK